MKVKDLIKLLKNVDQNREIIIQKDGEGNGYSPLSQCNIGAYRAYNDYSGEVGLESLEKQDIEDGFTEESVYDKKTDVSALILVPRS